MSKALTLKNQLIRELNAKDRHGVYGLTQRLLAYNSNKIEGSTLTEDQTADIFETGTLNMEYAMVRTKDIEEMTGHFAMMNHALQTLDTPLSENLIKEFHRYLKSGVFEDMANGYPCGEYKNKRNIVGRIETALPEEVPEKMRKLLSDYHHKDIIELKELAEFHATFEAIHPFQDGNGRVGRMILFREALANGIIPPVIRDDARSDYYYALVTAQTENNVEPLISLLENSQKAYERDIEGFLPI